MGFILKSLIIITGLKSEIRLKNFHIAITEMAYKSIYLTCQILSMTWVNTLDSNVGTIA